MDLKFQLVKNFMQNIRADKRADAYQWLRDNDLGDIIKNNISVTFGQGEENKAMAYANLAKEHGYEPSKTKMLTMLLYQQ